VIVLADAPAGVELAGHEGHFVHLHDHRWQPGRFPRCSCRYWCGTCREWFDGKRCGIPRTNYGLPK
jgi:hypothetical protein